jgi:hypothetical protein
VRPLANRAARHHRPRFAAKQAHVAKKDPTPLRERDLAEARAALEAG